MHLNLSGAALPFHISPVVDLMMMPLGTWIVCVDVWVLNEHKKHHVVAQGCLENKVSSESINLELEVGLMSVPSNDPSS